MSSKTLMVELDGLGADPFELEAKPNMYDLSDVAAQVCLVYGLRPTEAGRVTFIRADGKRLELPATEETLSSAGVLRATLGGLPDPKFSGLGTTDVTFTQALPRTLHNATTAAAVDFSHGKIRGEDLYRVLAPYLVPGVEATLVYRGERITPESKLVIRDGDIRISVVKTNQSRQSLEAASSTRQRGEAESVMEEVERKVPVIHGRRFMGRQVDGRGNPRDTIAFRFRFVGGMADLTDPQIALNAEVDNELYEGRFMVDGVRITDRIGRGSLDKLTCGFYPIDGEEGEEPERSHRVLPTQTVVNVQYMMSNGGLMRKAVSLPCDGRQCSVAELIAKSNDFLVNSNDAIYVALNGKKLDPGASFDIDKIPIVIGKGLGFSKQAIESE
jgi:hypothetical protein